MALFGKWWNQPTWAGLLRIQRFRGKYRKKRLHDTGTIPSNAQTTLPAKPPDEVRSADGSFNDLDSPRMGQAGTRFGRNFPLEETFPGPETNVLKPSPREVSRQLMTRGDFQPASILNLLAAAWIQFEVHDWFSHGKNAQDRPWQIPLENNDDWPEDPMEIRRTTPDTTRDDDGSQHPPTYLNTETHWWDGSQLYGSTAERLQEVRSHEDGKLALTSDGLLPVDSNGIDLTGVNGNWWLGLGMLHTLFTLEHNAIADHFRGLHSDWTDEQLFQKARLVNVALMSKIHTVDWTPGILAHPTTQSGLRGTWYGLRGEETLKEDGRRLGGSEIFNGIPGTKHNHHSAPYAMTEEFVSVYRMHPLMPDEFTIRRFTSHEELFTKELPDVSHTGARQVMESNDLTDLFYSFGVSHPGAIRLHNYPKFLQKLDRGDRGPTLDLAAVDILRDRERGVPRYNQFRRLLFKKPVKKWNKLTDNPQWEEEMRALYDNDLDQVDLMTGLYAEPLPPGFGFSETAFRVFSVMAPRRLQSDRFITDFYKPDVYTPEGIRWIEDNGFREVLLRHMPGLSSALQGVANPFAPWRKAV